MKAFRIADRRFPVFDASGARLLGGRWNSPGLPVIYAAETFSGALLEILAHAAIGRIPRSHAVVEISIPDDLPVESVDPAQIPGWDLTDHTPTRAFGDTWLREGRTAVLLVPSVVIGIGIVDDSLDFLGARRIRHALLELLLLLDSGLRAEERVPDGAPHRGLILVLALVFVRVLVVNGRVRVVTA